MTNSVSPHIIREYKLITSYPICEYGLKICRWQQRIGSSPIAGTTCKSKPREILMGLFVVRPAWAHSNG